MKNKTKPSKGRGRRARHRQGTLLGEVNETGRVYLSFDVHAATCVLGAMREDGTWLGEARLPTEAAALQKAVAGIKSPDIWLTFEEGGMSLWLCDLLRPLVQRLLVCDPRENASIARSAKKRDEWDVRELCRLFRLGELKEVWHSTDPARNALLLAAETYLQLRKEATRLKSVLKAWYRRGGVMVRGSTAYSGKGRKNWLELLPSGPLREGARLQYTVLDALEQQRDKAWQQVAARGRDFPEIARFMASPGIGPVGAHLFSALIGDPWRFTTRQQLWRYCKLGITDRTSDGKPLGYERLERHGQGELKAVSYHAWKGAIVAKDNEIKRWYEASLARTGSARHARLNTQRKIIELMWTLWRSGQDYDPQRFAGPPSAAETTKPATATPEPNTLPAAA
jgi:transposase